MFERFRRSKKMTLASANVAAEWSAGEEWRHWEAPSTFVVGESHYAAALHDLAGMPRRGGYLIPVAVSIVREAENPYDHNAFRVEVDGRQVGHIARHIAAQLAPSLDRAGCTQFSVCGLIRGGSLQAPNLGVHAWLGRRLSPGPEIVQLDGIGLVEAWPPRLDEGR